MKKIIKPAIFIVISILFVQSSYAQSQKDLSDYIKKKFLIYTSAVPREEIYLHSDRDEYMSGEDLWFNIYLIDRKNFGFSLNSKIVYFELLNAVNMPVVQKRIGINQGLGPGHVVIPDTLSTGIYTIRAYTSWMKNFLPYNCFIKEIKVYNTLNPKEVRLNVNKGHFLNKEGDYNLTTENNYRNITLNINNSKPDSLDLFVNADDKFRSENNNLFYIFIQTHGNINYTGTGKITQDTTLITVPKLSLGTGINQITLFDSKGKPVAERYIYTPAKENRFISIQSVDSCNLRNKIAIEIDAGNMASKVLNSSNLSISVAPEKTVQTSVDMNEYMVFGSEYGTQPWRIINSRKINDLPPEVIDNILLNARSNWIDWKVILSDEIPYFKYGKEKEYHLLSGKVVSSDQRAVHSSALLLMCMPGKEASFQYARTDDDGNFSFNLHIDEKFNDLIIMPENAVNTYKILIESSFSDRYYQSELSVDSSEKSVLPYISKLSVNHQVQKIFNNQAIGPQKEQPFQSSVPERFYGKPDIELILADYISLPDMGEIFFELLHGVYLKKKKSGYEVSIARHIGDNLFVTYPIIMIDGVKIKDPSMIANLDPEIVEKIDVIREKYLVGIYIFPGIVNVITKSGDFSCVSLPDYMTRLSYRVIDHVWSFGSPDYSSEETIESRIPDYRNTLYWNPSVKPGKDGKARVEFWSSDNKTDYLINVQGIMEDGTPVSVKNIIKVK